MNFISVILALCLAAVCSAQEVERPDVTILAAEEGCAPTEVLRTISCGCFITLFAAPTNAAAREQCRIVTGTAIQASQTSCDPFLIDNGTNYDFAGIIASVSDAKNRCFGGEVVQARNLLAQLAMNFAILQRGPQLFVLANQLCQIFEEPTASDVPALGRITNAKPAVRSALLKKFNNL